MSRARKPIKPPPEIIRPGGWKARPALGRRPGFAVEVAPWHGEPAYSGRLRREERLARIPEDWNLPWREVVSIEGGPNWSAAQFLALCCWPRKPKKRHEFAWSLLHAAAREADHSIPGPPDGRVIERRVGMLAKRLRRGFMAARIARHALEPPERPIGEWCIRGPASQAVGRDGNATVHRLAYLAGSDFAKLEPGENSGAGDADLRKTVWQEFKPALPQLMALSECPWIPTPCSGLLAMILQASEWVDQAIAESDEIALDLHQELEIPAEELILCGPAGRDLLRHEST